MSLYLPTSGDVEAPLPDYLEIDCDVLHHVGVLYHLLDPVSRLRQIAPFVRSAIMLDPYVAPPEADLEEIDGVRFWKFQKHGRSNPFAGMYDRAKWIEKQDLLTLIQSLGFSTIELIQERMERNGPRMLVIARRSG